MSCKSVEAIESICRYLRQKLKPREKVDSQCFIVCFSFIRKLTAIIVIRILKMCSTEI